MENEEHTNDFDQVRYLSYLLRAQNLEDVSDQTSSDSEEELNSRFWMWERIGKLDSVQSKTKTNQEMSGTDLKLEIEHNLSGEIRKKGRKRKRVGSKNILQLISERNIFGEHDENTKRRILSNFLPSSPSRLAQYRHKVFCGRYCGKEGSQFMTASQDCMIRMYDTERGQFRLKQSIEARDVGWSVLDVSVSQAGDCLVYSSWCENLHTVTLDTAREDKNYQHVPLALAPDHVQFCIFSVTFSNDDTEILGGSNDGCLYIYNRLNDRRTVRIAAHDNDVNSVCFLDSTTQVLASASDDGLCKVWDRRALREDNPMPVGVMAGHVDGLTHVSGKGDGRYLITNSKDQTIKLWDLRKFSGRSAVQRSREAVNGQTWDYRWQRVPRGVGRRREREVEGDTSVMTYSGHKVLQTLVRCHFSPMYSTGQKYIYTGSAEGKVFIYDLLTGSVVKELHCQQGCVRDVSWHPDNVHLISSSWDGSVVGWTCRDWDCVEEEEELREKKKTSLVN